MNKKLKNPSLFTAWFWSYISVLMVPIMISGFIYIESGKIVEKEINRANSSLLKQVQQVMDGRMKDVEQLCMQVAFNSRIERAMTVRGQFEDSHRFNIYKIIQDLRVYRSSNTFIDDFYVYLKNTNTVLTPSSHISGRMLYHFIHENDRFTYEQWIDLVEGSHKRNFVPIIRKKNNEETVKSIAFVQSVPVHNIKNPAATVIVLIDELKFKNIINNIQWVNQGAVFILNAQNQVLASTNPLDVSNLIRYEDLKKESDLLYYTLNGEKVALSYVTSQISEWKYVSIIPSRIFWEKAEYVRSLTIFGVLLCLVLGGVVSYFFARKNYNPIQEIVEAFVKKAGLAPEKKFNEYRFIQEAINTTINEKEEISRKMEQQNNVLRSNFLVRLIKGKLDEGVPVEDALSSYNITFYSDYFAVLLIYIDDFSEFIAEAEKGRSQDSLKLVQFIITNVLEELLEKDHKGFMVEVDDMMACIVNFKKTGIHDAGKQLEKVIRKAQDFIQNEFQIFFTASISEVHTTLTGIPQAYQESLDAMEYRMVMGGGEIIHYADVKDPQRDYRYSIETEQKLINCIKSGNFEGSKALLNSVFQQNLSNESLSVEMVKCLMFDLVSTMVKTMDSSRDAAFLDELRPVRRVLKCRTVMDMKYQMTEILKLVCDYIKEINKNNKHQLSDEVKVYINNNFTDVNLNVSAIGRHFNMTPHYLSKLFKEQTGEGLLDCINKVRLERAKGLLESQDISIREIAIKVGYSNSTALIRAFKKYEGLTPGQYKDLKQVN